ncbi:MAG: CDP-diacylglycerol--glycerol-3-phosphate 3-phosphatidyltransferase [Candidatus Muproteobacteria bacterium RBG_16_65_34]|uniref:CDP-diacylglycerol--glycerol-3-phosphate 3-phosphatidyltransferase n=1 Tax=Candidatus Muproteobacteria bacterium RBG_16_65_34 TaxID=1817760 RepID=A0A1F6TSP6_9PROT|nr:MAG: CDP-diacylglycerol--glycerol-3-phosphate 3-phosphatidyltransferase [Candidatus Muproteobacteria bacterium RBG_16_65_34]
MWNIPNLLTLLRLVLIPLFVLAYYLPYAWAHMLATGLFALAALTDWLDGYLARRLQQFSAFGAFLDPVADKLMVAAALVMLLADPQVLPHVLDGRLFAFVILVILGREIAVSALREWMAGLGRGSHVAVSLVGKVKTGSQMVAIPFLIWREPIAGLPVFRVGELLLYLAAGLTLWSMMIYLKAAWPSLREPGSPPKP